MFSMKMLHLISDQMWKTPNSNLLHWTKPIGPLADEQSYFVTRYPLPTVGSVNPFAALPAKFWLNYSSLYVITALAFIGIHLKLFHRMTFEHISATFVSPSILTQSGIMAKSALMLPCLASFTFWTFDNFFGVDLQELLVGQTFESKVNSWDDINFFETQFVFIPNLARYPFEEFSQNRMQKNLFSWFFRNPKEKDSETLPTFQTFDGVPNQK